MMLVVRLSDFRAAHMQILSGCRDACPRIIYHKPLLAASHMCRFEWWRASISGDILLLTKFTEGGAPMRFRLLALFSAMLTVGGCAPAPEESAAEEPVMQETLEGAWKITEESFESPAASWTNTSPQPSLYIFAE